MDDVNINDKYSSDVPLRGNAHGTTTSSSTSTRWITRTPSPADVNHDEDHYHRMYHRQQEKEQTTAAGSTRGEGQYYDSHSERYPSPYYDAPTTGHSSRRQQQHQDQQQAQQSYNYNSASAPPSYASTINNDNSSSTEKQWEKEQTTTPVAGSSTDREGGQHDSHSERYPPSYSYASTDHWRRQPQVVTERPWETEMTETRPRSANQERQQQQQPQQPGFPRNNQSYSYARHPNYGFPSSQVQQSRYYDQLQQQQQPAPAAGIRGYEPTTPHHQQQRYPPVAPPPAQYLVSPQMSPRLPPPQPIAPRFRVMVRPEVGPPDPWTTSIFGCLRQCYGCPLVFLAPCVAFGHIAEITDTGYNSCLTAGLIYAVTMLLGIPCIYSYSYRSRMRHHFNLREEPIDDFCLHFWCELCALSQEYRELAYRGIDPPLGYTMQEQVILQAMAAPVSPRMDRTEK